MVSFQVSGQPALRFKVVARSVLFAGSRRGQVEQPVCRALVERFRHHGFGFFVGCAKSPAEDGDSGIRVDQMRMERHHDSQRSGRLAIMFDDVRVVDRLAASIASLPRLGFDRSMMTRHDDSQRSGAPG